MATATAGTSNTLYWLALALTPGLGPTRGRKLVEDAAELFERGRKLVRG